MYTTVYAPIAVHQIDIYRCIDVDYMLQKQCWQIIMKSSLFLAMRKMVAPNISIRNNDDENGKCRTQPIVIISVCVASHKNNHYSKFARLLTLLLILTKLHSILTTHTLTCNLSHGIEWNGTTVNVEIIIEARSKSHTNI